MACRRRKIGTSLSIDVIETCSFVRNGLPLTALKAKNIWSILGGGGGGGDYHINIVAISGLYLPKYPYILNK